MTRVQELEWVSNPGLTLPRWPLLGNTRRTLHGLMRSAAHPDPSILPRAGSQSTPAAPHLCRLSPPPVYKLITRKAEVGPARAGCQPAEPSRRCRLLGSQRGLHAPARAGRPRLFTVGSAAGAAAQSGD